MDEEKRWQKMILEAWEHLYNDREDIMTTDEEKRWQKIAETWQHISHNQTVMISDLQQQIKSHECLLRAVEEWVDQETLDKIAQYYSDRTKSG